MYGPLDIDSKKHYKKSFLDKQGILMMNSILRLPRHYCDQGIIVKSDNGIMVVFFFKFLEIFTKTCRNEMTGCLEFALKCFSISTEK